MFDVDIQTQSQSLLHQLSFIEKMYEVIANYVGPTPNPSMMFSPLPCNNPQPYTGIHVPSKLDSLKRDVKVFNLCMGILHWTKREEYDKLDCSNNDEFILLRKELDKLSSLLRNRNYPFNQPMRFSNIGLDEIRESFDLIFKLHEKVIKERLAIIENSFLAYLKTVQ